MRALTIGTNALAPAIPPSTFPTPGVDYPARDIVKTGKPAPPATTLGNNPFKDDYAALLVSRFALSAGFRANADVGLPFDIDIRGIANVTEKSCR